MRVNNMKITTILILSMMCVACSKPLTNDKIIEEVEKCKNAGMSYKIYENRFNRIILVNCTP